jgi:hypothetical protein
MRVPRSGRRSRTSRLIGLTPLIFAMHYRPADPATPFVFELGTQLEWALGGLLVSVILLGMVLSKFIPKASK